MHNNGTLPNYVGDTKMKTHTANIDTNFYWNGTSKRASGGGWMGQMLHVDIPLAASEIRLSLPAWNREFRKQPG
jgi:hypothetical protein